MSRPSTDLSTIRYIQSRFFMDVHPPLAKLLITLMAWVSGFVGGSFDFKDIGSSGSRRRCERFSLMLNLP